MTGTGTKTDPYIVSTWNEFKEAAAYADAHISFPDGGGTIDMNEVSPNGISAISLNGVYVNGNGWIIRNLYADGADPVFRSSEGKTSYFDRLHFDNFYLKNSVFISSYTDGYAFDQHRVRFKNCKLSGLLYDSELVHIDGSETDIFSNCAINIEFLNNSYWNKTGYYLPFKNTKLKLSGHVSDNLEITLNNSYLIGELNCDNRSISIADTSTASIIDITTNGITSIGYAGTGVVLINTDKTSEATVSESFKQCTTEQLQDAAYLQSLGFPIGV